MVEELEEVALVGLFPLDAVGGEGAEVQALDVRAEQELLDEMRVFGEGGNNEGLADVGEHFRLRDFHDAGVGEHKLGVRERVILVRAGNERGLEVGLVEGFDLTCGVAVEGGDIGGAGILEMGGDKIVDAIGERGIGKTAEQGVRMVARVGWIFASSAARAWASSSRWLGTRMAEVLMQERPPLAEMDCTITSRNSGQRAIMSSPMRIFERPVPWTWMEGKAEYFFTVASLPNEMPRPHVVRSVSPPSWVVG